MYEVATMVGPVFRVALRYPVSGGLNNGFQGLPGTSLGRAQSRFELAEGPCNGVKVRRIGRQIQQACPAGFDQFGQVSYFMGRQVVEYDHVAGYQRGAEHLVEVGSKDVAVDGSVPAQQRPEAVGGKLGDERHVRAAPQRHGLVQPSTDWSTTVAAAVGQVGARLVYEHETSDVFFLNGFYKQATQFYYAFGGATRQASRCWSPVASKRRAGMAGQFGYRTTRVLAAQQLVGEQQGNGKAGRYLLYLSPRFGARRRHSFPQIV